MDFWKFPAMLAILLMTVLIVQPVLSANMTVTPVNIEKDIATGLFNSGEVLLNSTDYENAIRLFDQALASNITIIKKTDALLYLYRDKAYAQIQLGLFTEAVGTTDTGLSLYPSDAMLWNNRGWALQHLGNNQDALASYEKAVSFDGNYTNALINQGNLLLSMGKYTDAITAFNRANETDPFNHAAATGVESARKGEAGSGSAVIILLAIVVIVAAGICVWYVKFRKPATPPPEDKRGRNKKRE